jgi:hypothetical protein
MLLQEQPRRDDEKTPTETKDLVGLLAHFKGYSWMPFPAGSLVPRTEPLGLLLLNTHLNTAVRARLALETDFSADVIDLHRCSLSTWNGLYPKNKVHSLESVLNAWHMLAQESMGPPGVNDYNREDLNQNASANRDRWRIAQRRFDDRNSSIKKIHTISNPYPRSIYSGGCSQPATPTDADEIGIEETLDSVPVNALKAHDKWALLQRFWLRQLHSHHGYIMGKAKTNRPYHQAALGLLACLANEAPDHERGRVAAGLSRPDLVPDFDTVTAFKPWSEKLASSVLQPAVGKRAATEWPAAFRPATVGLPAANVQQACQIWQQLGYPPGEVDAVNRLAHEVASLMTDPWACKQLDWDVSGLKQISQSLYEARIKNKNAQAAEPKVDSTDRIERAWGSVLLFHHYTRWAGPVWADLQQAIETIPTP